MDEKASKNINYIKDKIQQPPSRLPISRIPKNTWKRFLEIANKEDFCDDFGMALKYLIDVHDGIIRTGVEHLEAGLIDLNKRLSILEAEYYKNKVNVQDKSDERRKRLDGTVKGMKRNEKEEEEK